MGKDKVVKKDPFYIRKEKGFSNKSAESIKPRKVMENKNKLIKKNARLNKKIANNTENGSKKPFDKKKWRLQKYSKKYKLEQWEDKRKKAVLREYYKSVKDETTNFDVEKIYKEHEEDNIVSEENENNLNTSIMTQVQSSCSNSNKHKPHKKAHLEFLRIKEEKNKMKEEAIRIKAEKEEALKMYKQKKVEKFKKLGRKTRKGQPIMKERMELLLEQIQKSMEN